MQIIRWSSLSSMKNVGVGYMEVERCRERMAEVEKDDECVTSHPGFESVCLNRWVLATAAIGLKTKQKKASTTLLAESSTTEDK